MSIVNSLTRALKVLEVLADSNDSIGVTELGRRLDIDKSRAYRLLATLVNQGYVEQDPETRKYKLGLKVVELGSKVLDKMELRKIAKPFMKELVQKTNQTTHMAALDLGDAVCIEQEETPSVVNVNMAIGRETPGHCTALGKILWAHLEEKELETLLKKKKLTHFTARTITSIPELKMHLEKIRGQGYALDDEEFTVGVRCIAVPVWSHKKKVVASLGISGLAVNISLDKVDGLIEIIMQIRDKLCSKLGYRE